MNLLRRLMALVIRQPDVRFEDGAYKVNVGASTQSADSLDRLAADLRARSAEARELRGQVAVEAVDLQVKMGTVGTPRVVGTGRHEQNIRDLDRALSAVQLARSVGENSQAKRT